MGATMMSTFNHGQAAGPPCYSRSLQSPIVEASEVSGRSAQVHTQFKIKVSRSPDPQPLIRSLDDVVHHLVRIYTLPSPVPVPAGLG